MTRITDLLSRGRSGKHALVLRAALAITSLAATLLAAGAPGHWY